MAPAGTLVYKDYGAAENINDEEKGNNCFIVFYMKSGAKKIYLTGFLFLSGN